MNSREMERVCGDATIPCTIHTSASVMYSYKLGFVCSSCITAHISNHIYLYLYWCVTNVKCDSLVTVFPVAFISLFHSLQISYPFVIYYLFTFVFFLLFGVSVRSLNSFSFEMCLCVQFKPSDDDNDDYGHWTVNKGYDLIFLNLQLGIYLWSCKWYLKAFCTLGCVCLCMYLCVYASLFERVRSLCRLIHCFCKHIVSRIVASD